MAETLYGSNEPVIFTMLMTPDMANFSGNVHGGNLLKLLDHAYRVNYLSGNCHGSSR
mgnify:CR=1 FL=1